ncbi:MULTISPECIES: choline/ethanolamine kinase family protein [unclassified Breznakia]|uniref:choline/ethanolamine kinase family protein n=1 Tax=unclassified Breznakia TaxID=2623764 RepID=UPI002476BCA9|nr:MULTISPECIES: choline/ethanolamine kinase family protein [unclassified Breznakia]MDH6366302.1 thiamine kinase-like enzyme [Breznakia sp. PH1-1]MDH6403395.1 thiamine kinase-like enzyme [Breznakia sp. PF1-11]MDH6411104.1 thiamine kinase-like enzyme [Breznakia sp. PFB1-11]MDH6413468.1 thiamine kinase-like enzyme [Breznakia sp. PFB1-14]MDH6416743.1 thiamine kinase-like enzyme [Breznakia sp. PFB1-4]
MQIDKNDKNQILKLVQKIFNEKEALSIDRLGGLTNHTYRVDLLTGCYVFRLPGEGTEELIDRKNEKTSTTLSSKLGIDTEIIYFDDDGKKITPYIPNAITMSDESLRKEDNLERVAKIFKVLHNSRTNTGVEFNVMKIANEYETFIKNHKVELPRNFDFYKKMVGDLYKKYKLTDNQLVPCHNDPLCENWIRSGDRMFLIDWEYAGMNDPLWDIADVSIEANYTTEHDELLLKAYKGKVTNELKKRFLLNKVLIDYLWSLWGWTRVPFEKEMVDYAIPRYERMKQSLIELGELL